MPNRYETRSYNAEMSYFRNRRISSLIVIAAVMSCVSASLVDIREFKHVTKETWNNAALGISLSYPYEWMIAPSPFGDAELYVEAPTRLPSLTVVVQESIPNIGLEQVAQGAIANIIQEADIQRSEEIEISGLTARQITFKWTYPQGDRIYLNSRLIALDFDGHLFLILGTHTALGDWDEGLLDSMTSIEFKK